MWMFIVLEVLVTIAYIGASWYSWVSDPDDRWSGIVLFGFVWAGFSTINFLMNLGAIVFRHFGWM